jgi:phosphohistidine phosphatase
LRRLVLFRHGPAGTADPNRWPDDSLRPLTERGEARTRKAARGLARLIEGDVVLWTSPFARARRTAELLAQAFEGRTGNLREVEALEPGAQWRALEPLVGRVPASATLVWVGHEPDLGAHAARFLAAGAPLSLKKAGACALAFEGPIRPSDASLEAWLPPRVLRALARGAGRK